jgi:hypothetical protein
MAERQESIDYNYIKLLIKTLDKVLEALSHARNLQKRPQGADENLTSESDEVLELLHYLSDQATEDGGKSFISEIHYRVMAFIDENDKDAAKEVEAILK